MAVNINNVNKLMIWIVEQVKPLILQGKLPDYIPQLRTVDQRQFGMAFITLNGEEFSAGDADIAFSIQSISKLFALMLALQRTGDDLWKRVGREPSGTPFNELVQIEREEGLVRNPFINAGALVITDILCSGYAHPELALLQALRKSSRDESVIIDQAVMRSERESCHRNAAIAYLLKSYGRLNSSVDLILDTYCRQCALAMSCRQIARCALSLVSRSTQSCDDILSDLSLRQRHSINALMLTCGMYNAAGEYAARVGLPLKSGVGGGIVALIPGVGSLCVWSPGLDEIGNSLAAGRAIELFVQHTKYHF
ncbi:TPA: glutaminase [Klebsiella quasipneumoniae]|nr:glutaminase [Klebsiella quasipneumoniae]